MRQGPKSTAKRRSASPYAASTRGLKAELRKEISAKDLREIHKKSAVRHFLTSGRQIAAFIALASILISQENPWIWIPAAVVQGFVIFSFSVLLHDVVHRAVFVKERPRLLRALGFVYGLPSGLAPSQFERWHLDHHKGLGTVEQDPKRHYLSPKVNARWFKLLYATPALFFIYFRAAAREGASYGPELKKQISMERLLVFAFHGSLALLYGGLGGGEAVLRAWVVPTFFVFPVAFTINRLGQHYDITPGDPRKWSTLVRRNLFWDFVFLNSGYHLEHHYFPAAPLYRLPGLQGLLWPYFLRIGTKPRGFSGILWDWFVRNKKPHTDWGATRP